MTADSPGPTVSPTTSSCEHLNFAASVEVARITKVDGGPAVEFMADITVHCAECHLPFRWRGLPMGMSYDKPMVSIDGYELRAPLEPDVSESIARLERLEPRGFTISAISIIGDRMKPPSVPQATPASKPISRKFRRSRHDVVMPPPNSKNLKNQPPPASTGA